MKKIIIHYPFIPNYRIPVFNQLASESDIEVLFLSALDSSDPTLLAKNNGWKFNHVPTILRSFYFFNRELNFEFGVVSQLFKNKGEYSYYVILSNPNIMSSWIYSVFAKLFGYKVIFWGHGLLKEDKGIKKIIRNIYYKIPDKHWLYGNNGKKLLIKNGVSENKISVIYNSLNYDLQKNIRIKFRENRLDIRKGFGFTNNDFVLIIIGRLLPKLEIDKVIKYISLSKSINLKLVIIGDGPERKNLEILSKDLNVNSSVIFTGALYDENIIGNYYVAADASVVMGVVGLAAMHSLAYGIPMITHSSIQEHCPEIEAIIPGVSGEFFNKNDLDSFLLAISKIKNNKLGYRDNCIDIIEKKYNPSKQVELMLESLEYEN